MYPLSVRLHFVVSQDLINSVGGAGEGKIERITVGYILLDSLKDHADFFRNDTGEHDNGGRLPNTIMREKKAPTISCSCGLGGNKKTHNKIELPPGRKDIKGTVDI